MVPPLRLPVRDVPEIGAMEPFGRAHLGTLALVVLACVVLVPLVRRRGDGPTARAVTTAAGWVLLIVTTVTTLLGMRPEVWSLGESLPFHLSDWLRVILAIALITRAPWAVVTSIYWGLTLNLQAVLTPDLRYFRNEFLEFLQYWGLHGFAFVAAVALVAGYRLRPTWRGYGVSCLVTVVWAATALGVNAVAGTNYGYLAHPPSVPTLLDLLGPWPGYVLVEVVLVLGGWALLTALAGAGRTVPEPGGGGLLWRAGGIRSAGPRYWRADPAGNASRS